MRTRPLFAILAAVFAAGVLAQQPVPTSPSKKPAKPVFSAPEGEEPAPKGASRPARPDPKDLAPVEAPPAQPPQDPVETLFARLAKWPEKSARDAAVALSGLGAEVEGRLIQNLGNNDWRVQAGSARALAEMGSTTAVKALGAAIKDPTNGAALSELMLAIVRIDPANGPKEVIPFLSHQVGRVRQAALAAIPNPLDGRYVEDAAQMFQSRNAPVRATGIQLMTRIPDAAQREEFFLAISDPEVSVANPAARHLAAFADEAGLRRLAGMAREGTLRQAAYSFLALTVAEDTRGVVLILDSDPARDRAYQMLQGEEPFYRAAAAVFLANLGFRTDDATLRTISDKYLVPILLEAVAGGNFFNDYVAIEELGYRKLELLSGESFGQNSLKWRAWWQRASESFKARHQLRALAASELAHCTISVRVEEAGGRIRSAIFVGDPRQATPAMAGSAYVLGERERETIKAALESSRFFIGRSDPDSGIRIQALTEITVQCGSDRFTRRHSGEVPPDLVPLVNTLFDVARSLSWQSFAPSEPTARATYIAEQTEFFAKADAATQRERLLVLALSGYPSFGRDGKRAAVEILRVSSPEFRQRNAARLLELLRSEPALNDDAAALIGVLGTVDAVPVRDQVLAFLGKAPAGRANDVVRDFLARQPKTNVMAALRSEAAVTRVAAAEALGRFKGDRDVVSVLIDAIADFDPRVRDAVIKTLATMEDERIPAMLEAAVAGPDKSLRIRALEALGAVQQGAAVPRLMEVYRSGSGPEKLPEKFAVIRALGQIPEKRATVALGSIVRESADVQLSGEALNVLARSTDPGAADEVAEIFRKSKVPDIRLQAVGALASLRGADAIPDLLPSLESDDPDLRRVSLMTLARLGARETLKPLVDALSKPEGDAAAEAAFNRLTFFVSDGKAAAHRALEYQRFMDEAGPLSRTDWFLRAIRGLKLDPAVLDGFELGAPLDAKRFGMLLRVLADGNWALRNEADSRLLAETGLKLTPLARVTSAEEVQERLFAYRRWLESNPDALSGMPKKKAESKPESR
jgi:HEAT repeat protein